MPFKKGNKYGNRFSTSNQPKKRGGKTNIFAQLKKDVEKAIGCKISDVDIKHICAFALLGNAKMHNAYLLDEDGKASSETPMIIMNLIRAIQIQTKMGRTDTLDKLVERLYGKVAQPIDGEISAQVTNTSVDLSALATDELLQYNALLEKIKKGKDDGTK